MIPHSAFAAGPAREAQSPWAALAAAASHCAQSEFLHVPASAARAYAQGPLSYTYAQAHAEATALAARYRQAGYGAGHRVALLLENRPAYFLHWFALNALGVSVVPVNPDYRRAELGYLLAHSEAALVVGLGHHLDDLREAVREAGSGAGVCGEDEVLPPARASAPIAPQRSTECALMYTSGTTGKPKGCLLSNDYFMRMGLRYLDRRGYVELEPGRSRVLTPLPMFHMNAMAGSTMGVVMSASCLIQLDRFHPRGFWQDVAATRATGIHCLGVMPAMLLGLPVAPEERQHQVRYGTAAAVDAKHHAAFEERFGFPLIEGWAMTETGAGAAIGADAEPRHLGTRCFGKLPPEIEIRFVDEQGADVPEGEPGEMLVRRKGAEPRLGFFSGYLKDDHATQAGWAGGWWHTGDVACRWPDGTLHFVDRRKNVIRRSGENISALEVEEALRTHPAVAHVAVTAVPDEIRGEEVMACVVPSGAAGVETARMIFDWADARLAYFKAPGWVAFVRELPVTATQKVQRGALREQAAALRGEAHDLRALKQRQRKGEQA